MNELLPTYTELYSISDLHMGGHSPQGQIFNQGGRLRAFIEQLAGRPGPLALVIAGDFFDTLPYLNASYIAVDGAADLLQAIISDASFAPVFAGLRAFLENDQRELIVLIGNHDLEIAFPETQEQLLQEVAPGGAARGRVRFSTSGGGFRCRVGDRIVYITHGNEADPWNHVDYEALRRAAHARALGQTFDPRTWIPNAGSKLVIDVMNGVKTAHPFIDLLKPETRAAVKVLAALAPKSLYALFDALPAFAEAAWAHAGPHVVLGHDRRVVTSEPPVVRLLAEASRMALEPAGHSTTALLERVKQLHDEGRRPSELVSDEDARLGWGRYIRGRLMGETPAQSLRVALQEWVDNDDTFRLQHRDSTFDGITSQLGRGTDVVITGHTHLPRWIVTRERNLTYLNSGTWARLIGLRPAFLENDAAFAPVYKALMSPDLATLDQARMGDGSGLPLVLDATAAAHVVSRKRTTTAELVRITGHSGTVQERPVDPAQSVLEWL
jgi:UDP-2,3-diacylglucosamine pyrophosphatase LpxH